MRRKILCAVLSLLMVVSLLPIVVGAADNPTITFEQQTTAAGASEVKVDVKITNNPGFVSATIPVKWDASVMTLSSIENTESGVLTSGWCGMTMDDYATNGTQGKYYLAWNNDLVRSDFTSNGTLCTLVFKLVDATVDTSCTVQADMTDSLANVMNFDMDDLRDSGLTTTSGQVIVRAQVIGEDEPTISVVSDKGKAGDEVEIQITMAKNPGIVSMTLTVDFDSKYLTLKEVVDGDGSTTLLPGQAHSNKLSSPYTLCWVNDASYTNFTDNGVLATLKFTISEDAPVGQLPIKVSYDPDNPDIYNVDIEAVDFAIENGCVNVIDYISGDVDGNGVVNVKDRVALIRYLANWDGYEIDEDAADMNEDGKVNVKDRVILIRHLAKWEGYETLPMPVE